MILDTLDYVLTVLLSRGFSFHGGCCFVLVLVIVDVGVVVVVVEVVVVFLAVDAVVVVFVV